MAINFPNSPSASDRFSVDGVTYVFDGSVWVSVGLQEVGPTGPMPNLLGVESSVVPASDLVFDLGASDSRWRDLYLSGSSIFLGDAVLSSSDGGLSVSSSGGASVAFLTASDAVDFADAVHTHTSSDVTNFVAATQGVVTKAYVDSLSINAATLDSTDSSGFASAAQGLLADTAVQPGESLTVPDGGTIGSVSDTDAISIAAGGDVTISQDLIVTGDVDAANITVDDKIIHSGDTDTAIRFPAGNVFSVETNNAERLRVDASGNVGIGTTSPNQKVHVSTGGSTYLQLSRTASGTEGNLFVGAATNSNEIISRDATNGNKDLTFYTGTSERMRIDSSGNVGIGTTSPGQRLGVVDTASNGLPFLVQSEDGSTGTFAPIAQFTSNHTGDGGNTWLQVQIDPGNSGVNNGYVRLYSVSGGTHVRSNLYLSVRDGGGPVDAVRILRTGAVYMPNVYSDTVTGRDLYISSIGQLGYVSSIREAKTNIQDLSSVSWLYDLNPVSFQYRKKQVDEDGEATNGYTDEAEDTIEYGLIAEDVEAVNKDLVFYDETEDGPELRGVQYSRLIAPLIAAVKELKQEVSVLQAELAALKG